MAFFNPASAFLLSLSSVVNLEANSLHSCFAAPKDFLASMWRWTSFLASFQAFLTYSSVTKTAWVICTKMIKQSHVKKNKGEKAYLYSIKRYDYKLTMARSIFKDKKRFGYLMCLKAFMSLGKRRGCSKASAMWAECPLWNFLIEEFQGIVVPSTSSQGDHVRC